MSSKDWLLLKLIQIHWIWTTKGHLCNKSKYPQNIWNIQKKIHIQYKQLFKIWHLLVKQFVRLKQIWFFDHSAYYDRIIGWMNSFMIYFSSSTTPHHFLKDLGLGIRIVLDHYHPPVSVSGRVQQIWFKMLQYAHKNSSWLATWKHFQGPWETNLRRHPSPNSSRGRGNVTTSFVTLSVVLPF